MAATGQIMILFVILHVAGNSTIYFNRDLNTYAAGLHAIPVLLWAIRIVLFAAVLVHIFFAVQLTLENSEARPQSYRKKKNLTSTFAGRNMVWTGSVIGTFVVYHLLHFTFQVIDTGSAAAAHPDALGRPDVFSMVVAAFRHGTMVLVYGTGLAALWLHLSHGIESAFQTWGLNGERSFPAVQQGSTLLAIVLLLAYAAIPVVIFTGLLR